MKEFTIITETEYGTRFPQNELYNIEDMDQDMKEYFFQLYSLYYHLLIKYVIKKTNLTKYDNHFLNSPLHYKVVEKENMDIYQSLSSDNLNYFYIRNNVYLDRLSNEERAFLSEKLKNDNTQLSMESEMFIENTFNRVIMETTKSSGENCVINFGPEAMSFYAPINALVIGFRYDEFSLNGMDDNAWDQQNYKQREEIPIILNSMKTQFSEILNMPVYNICYNEFSIKKRYEA